MKFTVDKNHKIECPTCDAMSPEVVVTPDGESTHKCPAHGRFTITHGGDIVFLD